MVKTLTCTTAALLLTAATASADVQVAMNNGRVSIIAKDATVRQILTEWARVGQTKVVNVDRIPGGPLTLELTDIPEGQALDVLLKSVSGYVAAPRQTPVASLSVFDRIIVMPTVAAPRPAVSSQPAPPAFQQPQFAPAQQPNADDDDDPPAPNVQTSGQQRRGPVFNAFPPPQVGAPQQGPSPVPGPMSGGGAVQTGTSQPAPFGGTPSAPPGGGVPVPGMVAPAQQSVPYPASPSVQPPPPGQPGQITRPGGRGGSSV